MICRCFYEWFLCNCTHSYLIYLFLFDIHFILFIHLFIFSKILAIFAILNSRWNKGYCIVLYCTRRNVRKNLLTVKAWGEAVQELGKVPEISRWLKFFSWTSLNEYSMLINTIPLGGPTDLGGQNRLRTRPSTLPYLSWQDSPAQTNNKALDRLQSNTLLAMLLFDLNFLY